LEMISNLNCLIGITNSDNLVIFKFQGRIPRSITKIISSKNRMLADF